MLQKLVRCTLRAAALILGLGLSSSPAMQITSYDFNPSGHFEVQFGPTDTSHYYILYRGTEVTNVDAPVSLAFGLTSTGLLADTNFPGPAAYYRVLEVSTNQPVDFDGDGIDDVYEWLHPGFLDPLNPSDAQNDQDVDGFSNLQEYLWGSDPTHIDPFPRQRLVINEIDYDNIGTDTAEFVELYNGSTNTLHMDGLALVFINGASSNEYSRVSLTGTLVPGQYYAITSTNVTVAPGALVTYFTNSLNAIQNGAPDGVALIQVSTHTLVDAFSYEGPITNAVINDAPGTYNLVHGTFLPATVADSNAFNGSLIRNPNGMDSVDDATDWSFTTTPTPGAANISSP